MLGSVRALTDAAGSVTDTYDYSAYGELVGTSGSTPNSYRFTGEQQDSETGLYYNRARYYNPSLGRFTQQDSWMGASGNPITLNKYLYANSNPVRYVDPSGRASNSENMAAIATAGAVAGIAAYYTIDLSYRAYTGSAYGLMYDTLMILREVSAANDDDFTDDYLDELVPPGPNGEYEYETDEGLTRRQKKEKDREHDAYHKMCDKPIKPFLRNPNKCQGLLDALNQAEKCAELRLDWIFKWVICKGKRDCADHKSASRGYGNIMLRIKNLKLELEKVCGKMTNG